MNDSEITKNTTSDQRIDLMKEIIAIVIASFVSLVGSLVADPQWQTAIVSLSSFVTIGFLTRVIFRCLKIISQKEQDIGKFSDRSALLEAQLSESANRISELDRDLSELHASTSEANAAFSAMADGRMRFDSGLFKASTGHARDRTKIMKDSIDTYFCNVCNHVVNLISLRFRINPDMMSSDIKIIKNQGRDYRIVGRSEPSSFGRRDLMRRRSINDKNDWPVHTNIHLKKAAESRAHQHIIRDLPSYRRSKAQEFVPTGKFTAPTAEAEEFYQTSLTVAMFINDEDFPIEMVGFLWRRGLYKRIQGESLWFYKYRYDGNLRIFPRRYYNT